MGWLKVESIVLRARYLIWLRWMWAAIPKIETDRIKNKRNAYETSSLDQSGPRKCEKVWILKTFTLVHTCSAYYAARVSLGAQRVLKSVNCQDVRTFTLFLPITRVLTSFAGFRQVLAGFEMFWQISTGFGWSLEVLPDFGGFWMVLVGFERFLQVLEGFNRF